MHLTEYIKLISKTQTSYNNKGQIFTEFIDFLESRLERGLRNKDLIILFINSLNKLLKGNIKDKNKYKVSTLKDIPLNA